VRCTGRFWPDFSFSIAIAWEGLVMWFKIFRLPAIVGLSLVTSLAPTCAAVFQASINVFAGHVGVTGGGSSDFSLPRFSGPGTITGVTIAASGSGMAQVFFNYFEDQGITVAPFSLVWTIGEFGPARALGATEALDLSTTVEYSGASVPPNANAFPSHELGVAASADFSGSVDLTDFSDFDGSGSNDFNFYAFVPGQTEIQASGTVTETITFTTPEASTWVMMALGFTGIGFTGWRRSRMTAAYAA
jgi:PEP-CTERM motif